MTTTLMLLTLAIAGVVVVEPSVAAADGPSMQITTGTAFPVLSGAPVNYDLFVECTNVTVSSCNNMQAVIPIPANIDLASVTVTEFPGDLVASWTAPSDLDRNLRITFVSPFSSGSSITVPITMATNNGTTPNGDAWTVAATLTADGYDPLTSSAGGSAQAYLALAVDKELIFRDNEVPVDQDVTYGLKVCDANNRWTTDPGKLDLVSGTLVDTLPPGAVYVSSTPAGAGTYDPQAHTITWTVPAGRLGACVEIARQFTVTLRYPSSTFGAASLGNPALITTVTNEADVSGTAVGEQQPQVDDDDVVHQFSSVARPGGSLAKGAVWNYTFAGEWLPDNNSRYEVTWTIDHADTTGAHGLTIHDRLPCSTPAPGRSAHVSPGATEGICQAPTFVTERINIVPQPANPAAPGYQAAINAGWRPQYVTPNGSTGPLTLVPNTMSFTAPAGVTISELIFPYDPNIVFPVVGYGYRMIEINGRMIPDVPDSVFVNAPEGAEVKNRADFTIHDPQGNPVGESSDDASVRVLPNQLIANIVKDVKPNGDVELTVANNGLVPFRGIWLTDHLPINVAYNQLQQAQIETPNGWVNVDNLTPTISHNYAGTGRQLVRLIIPNSVVLQPGRHLRVRFGTIGLRPDEVPVGTTFNTAQLFLHSPDGQLAACRADGDSPAAPPARVDPFDFDQNGNTALDRFCESTDSVVAAPAAVELNTAKLVRGNLDFGFQPFPAVGSASDIGGSGEFQLRLTNRSAISLVNAVVYDVLPVPGDTGVRSIAEQRGSQFRTPLSAEPTVVTSNAGASPLVEYSTAANPCRGELVSAARDTWPTGCVDDWSTVIPPGGLQAVTAIRVSGLGTFPPNSGNNTNVTITVPVTVPDSANRGEAAWNSFAVAADRSGNRGPILPTEPAKVALTVDPITDVELTKTVNGQKEVTVRVGEDVTYRITVRHGTTTVQGPNGVQYVNGGDTARGAAASKTATGVVVRDFMPSAMLVDTSSATDCASPNPAAPKGSVDLTTGVWSVGTIRPNESFDLCFRARLTVDSPGTRYPNFAEVSQASPLDIDSTPGNMPPGSVNDEDDEDQAAVVSGQSNLTIAKTRVNDPAQPVPVDLAANRYTTAYDVTVTNTGSLGTTYQIVEEPRVTAGATITRVEVTGPNNLAIDTAITDPVVSVSIPASGTVAIAPSASHTYRVIVTFEVAPSVNASDRPCDTSNNQLGQHNTASVTDVIRSVVTSAVACASIPQQALTIEKSAATELVGNPDGSFTANYTITARNTGGPGTYVLTETPQFPGSVTIESMSISSSDPATAVDVIQAPFTYSETFEIGAGTPAQPATQTFDVAVTFRRSMSITVGESECELDTPGHGAFNQVLAVGNGVTSRDTACIDIPRPFPDLEITKSDGDTVAAAGGAAFGYRIVVTNVGERDVDADDPVTVTDELPVGLQWVAPAPDGCVVAGQTLTCEIDPSRLQVAESVEIVASARALAETTAGTVVNRAIVTTPEDPACSPTPCEPQACPSPGDLTIDADPANNVACEPTPIVRSEPPAPAADLAIVKSTQSTPAAPGSRVRWDLAIINHGPATAAAVVIEDTVPASLLVTDVTSTTFQCTRDGNRIRCLVPTLAAGASGIVQVQTVVAQGTPAGTIRNVATVGSQTPDTNPNNNTDDATVPVEIAPQSESASPTPPTRLPLPRTGSEWTLLLLRAGLMIVVAGTAIVLIARRRTHEV